MGVASPFLSRKPVEYWLDGLKTAELVQLWEFLSRNLDSNDPDADDSQGISVLSGSEDLPSGSEVRKHLYSETLPLFFYACKDRGDPPRILTPPKGE